MKKAINITLLLFFVISIFQSCLGGVKKEAELQNRISDLENQLDDCKNGTDKLFAKVKIAFENKNFENFKSIYFELENRHPESPEYQESKKLYDRVIQIEEANREELERVAEMEKEKKLKALNKLKKKLDDVSGVTWYYNPYFTHYNNENLTSIYIGDKGESNPWLILKMSYFGDDWIFFDEAYLSYNGNTKQILFNKYDDKKTEHDGGEVWEWIQVSVTPDIELFLREFANSKNAKMRLSGKYSKTRALKHKERRAILDVLNGYYALK